MFKFNFSESKPNNEKNLLGYLNLFAKISFFLNRKWAFKVFFYSRTVKKFKFSAFFLEKNIPVWQFKNKFSVKKKTSLLKRQTQTKTLLIFTF